MPRLPGLLCALCLVAGPGLPADSTAATGAEPWQQRAAAKTLADQRYWLTLLHYNYKSPLRRSSYVDDPAFFLSPDGNSNPAAELNATLAAFFAKPDTQCRFVARRAWLGEQLPGLTDALPAVSCEDYDGWRTRINANEVVLVMAASYLNSPSSMYGHTFLRFDPPDAETPLLSYVLNFGANVGADDSGLLYAWRGIAGGYPGVFAADNYLEKSKEYTRLENRDLWEYHLNLTPAEVDRMLAHVWELDQVNFDYYFFDENCSYRLLELFDAARPGLALADDFEWFAIPIDTVRVVADAGLVDRVVYRAADQTVIKDRIDKLGPDAAIAYRLSSDLTVREEPAFTGLPASRQGEVTDVAYKYYRYLHNTAERTPAIAEQSFALLRMQRDYDLPDDYTAPPLTPVQPDWGHRTMLLSATVGSEERDFYTDLEWRLAYHDLLDPAPGYPDGMSLNMGRFVLRAREGDAVRLQELSLVEIRSLIPRDRFFQPWSWQVQTGLDRQWTAGSDELVPQLNGGVGVTYGAPLDGRVFTLARSRLEYNSEFDRELDIAGGAAIGFLRQGVRHNTLLEAEQLWFTDGEDRTTLKLGHNFLLKDNRALRLHVKRSVNDSVGYTEFGLGYRHYF